MRINISKVWFILISLLSISLCSTASEYQCEPATRGKKFNVVFFKPDSADNAFWKLNQNFADAVADDLNINLKVVNIERVMSNRLMFAELLDSYIDENNRPDFIVSVLFAGGELSLIRRFNELAIPTFTVNSSLGEEVVVNTGDPRQKFPYWMAHMSPNEKAASSVLITEMHKLTKGQYVLAIGGDTQSAVNHQRIRGLTERASELKLHLAPPIFTNWTRQDALRVAETLFRRVRQPELIWTAGPSIASAMADVLRRNKNFQQDKIVIGTFDWSPEAIELVKNGSVDMSYGGHFMETGWALVLVHDYLHGLDFQQDTGTMINSELRRMDKSNVNDIEKLVSQQNWQDIDFKRYSKCLNADLDRYDFSLSAR